MWPRRVLVALLVPALLAAGCRTDRDQPEADQPPPQRTSAPAAEVTVLDGDAETMAIEVSIALFDSTPVVVLVGVADRARHAAAAETAVTLGAPLLLTPSGPNGDTDAALARELARLDPATVVAASEGAGTWAQQAEVVNEVVSAEEQLPEFTPPPPLDAVALLSRGEPVGTAATATARAAGARVLVTEVIDPRADPAVIAELSDLPASHVIALGEEFGPVEALRQRLAVVETGVELPGGAQVLFPGRVLVALYGHPGDNQLGALGEQPLEDALARAEQVAAEYAPLLEEPVVPTLEIITTVASSAPGPAGDYSLRTPPERLRPWIDAAAEAGMYVVLDLQPGHTDFLTQAREYEQLLLEPHVGLALDPEWRLAPHQRHMVQIGSVDAEEVNQVTDWLAELTREHRLPQKLLILHQFTRAMITDRTGLDTDRDEVAVLIHADGFGTPGQKFHTWETLHRDAPDVWWGWKNFYDEDQPTFTPAETVAVEPLPRFVSYQ